jgi:hypothetical protein
MIHLASASKWANDSSMDDLVRELADTLVLGSLLESLRTKGLDFEVIAHWTQGEFHHDVVLGLPTVTLVVATNCNGGVKEVLAFNATPDRYALWHWRCPHIADFSGELPELLARATTQHHFDPCELLKPDARSEILPEHRTRQLGGGWELGKRCR